MAERKKVHSSPLEVYILSIIRGRSGVLASVVRGVLSVLSILYSAGLQSYLFLYRIKLKRTVRLKCPVVCVGNITTGGTGKTPTVEALCRLLQYHGKRPAIILRGYGGENEYGCAVVSDGDSIFLTAAQSGDEAQLLAKSLPGIPIIVGKDRIRSGRLAIERFSPDLIIMDDGFQHWRLHRDCDIVLLNAERPFDNGWTLPRGMLREPKRNLRRADIVLLTGSEQAGTQRTLESALAIAVLAPEVAIFKANLEADRLESMSGDLYYEIIWLKDKRILAMSAIGNPDSFDRLLTSNGANLVATSRYKDHEAIDEQEFSRLCEIAVSEHADAIITTVKDAVKLPLIKTKIPILILIVEMRIQHEAAFLQQTLSRIETDHAIST